MSEKSNNAAPVRNTVVTLSLLISAGAVLYTGVPLLVNAWGTRMWVTPHVGASFVVWLAAVVASTRLAEEAWRNKLTFRFAAAVIGVFLWAALLFLLSSYCPRADLL